MSNGRCLLSEQWEGHIQYMHIEGSQWRGRDKAGFLIKDTHYGYKLHCIAIPPTSSPNGGHYRGVSPLPLALYSSYITWLVLSVCVV